MSPKILPVNRLIYALLALLLGWGSLSAWSQQEPGADADSERTSGSPSSTSASTTEPPEQAGRPDKRAAEPVNEDSPFDYQASEEISQDLSVSFPVDI